MDPNDDWILGEGWSLDIDKANALTIGGGGTNLLLNPNFGSELIVDGTFPTGTTAWSEVDGGTIIGNEMYIDCGNTTNAYTFQSATTAYTAGKTYQVTVRIISNTTGVALIMYPFSNSPNTTVITLGTTAGTYTVSFVADYTTGTGKTFVLRALSSTGVLVIDNVSVAEDEVTYPNFTNSDLSQWQMAETGGVDRATPGWDAAEFMRLTYDLAIGAALFANFGHTLNASYKVTMRVRGTKSDGVTAQGSAFGSIGDNGNVGKSSLIQR